MSSLEAKARHGQPTHSEPGSRFQGTVSLIVPRIYDADQQKRHVVVGIWLIRKKPTEGRRA
jgi:hypothetical protein